MGAHPNEDVCENRRREHFGTAPLGHAADVANNFYRLAVLREREERRHLGSEQLRLRRGFSANVHYDGGQWCD